MRLRILPLPALTLVSALTPALAQPCREGIALFEKGDLAGARAALVREHQFRPSATCAKALGVTYAAAGDYRAAEPHFADACRRHPAEPEACYFWARALYSLDRFEASLAALDKAPAGSAKPWRIATARGQALDALQRPDAEPELRKAIGLRKQDPAPVTEPDPLLSLTAFLYRQGRATEAMTLLTAAERSHAGLAAYHYQRGRVLAHGGQWAPAVTALRQAVELRPSYPEAHGLLSRCYYRLGRDELGAAHQVLARQ